MKNSDIRREQPKKRSTFKKVLVFLFVICFIAAAGAAADFLCLSLSHLPDVAGNITPNGVLAHL